MLSRRVVGADDSVVTELISSVDGAPPLQLINHESSPPTSTSLKIGSPVSLPRGKAEITTSS